MSWEAWRDGDDGPSWKDEAIENGWWDPDDISQAIKDMWLERERQMTEEGWTEAHDDEHLPGHLARAGACYALYGSSEAKAFSEWLLSVIRSAWPLEWPWFKPKGRRHDLVRAAALIIAEIEKLDRAEKAGVK